MADVPEGHLVPYPQGRLEYVKWALGLQDRLIHSRCIDIGTGPIAIYARLLCEINEDIEVYCTEIDEESFLHAKTLVSSSPYLSKVFLYRIFEKSDILSTLSQRLPDVGFDFCVCNPPYFDDSVDVKSRKKTVMKPSEGFFPGGEVAFCKLLIEQSFAMKDRLRYGTCLLGRKASLPHVRRYCWEHGAKRVTTAVFCPNTTRTWAIAWTFHSNVKFLESRKIMRPLFVDVQDLEHFLGILKDLDIDLEECGNLKYRATSKCLTWSRMERRKKVKTMINLNFTINLRPWGTAYRAYFDIDSPDDRHLIEGLVSHIRNCS